MGAHGAWCKVQQHGTSVHGALCCRVYLCREDSRMCCVEDCGRSSSRLFFFGSSFFLFFFLVFLVVFVVVFFFYTMSTPRSRSVAHPYP